MKKKIFVLLGLAISAFVIANLVVFILNRDEIAVSDLRVGDCLNEFYEGDSTRVVKPVVCSVDHVQEVVGVFPEAFEASMTDAPTASDAALLAAELCVPAFNEYTQLDYENVDFEVLGIYPDADAWDRGQRSIVCVASNADRSLIQGTLGALAI